MRPFEDAGRRGIATAAAWVAALVMPVAAETAGSMSKPVLGYVFEAKVKAVRVIAGVPGSAVLGDAVANSSKIESAFPAPGREYAIAESQGDGGVGLVRWRGVESSLTELPAAARGAALVAYSPRGYAAIYFPETAKVQVWGGLPDNPSLAREFESVGVRALAVSDDGASVVAVTSSGLWIHSEQGSKLLGGGEFSAVAFLPASQDVAAAEPAFGRVVKFRAGEGNFTELAGAAQGVVEPSSLAVSRDGRRLAVANGRAGILLVNLETGAVTAVGCEFRPESVSGLSGDAVFLVEAADRTLWVLDFETEARLVFAGGLE